MLPAVMGRRTRYQAAYLLSFCSERASVGDFFHVAFPMFIGHTMMPSLETHSVMVSEMPALEP